jgi:hypothetical protein
MERFWFPLPEVLNQEIHRLQVSLPPNYYSSSRWGLTWHFFPDFPLGSQRSPEDAVFLDLSVGPRQKKSILRLSVMGCPARDIVSCADS